MADLATLYQGALLGQARAGAVGTAQQEGQNLNDAIRANLLATAVATGKLNPASLSPADTASVAGFLGGQPKPVSSGGGGIFSTLLKPFDIAGKIVGNTAGTLAGDVTGFFTQGIPTIAEATYRSFNGLGNAINKSIGLPTYATPKGPNLADVGKQMVQGTIHDFTHIDPMNPINPILDVASLASLGAGGAFRAGSALSKVGEEGSALSKLGDTLVKTTAGGPRPIFAETDYARAGIQPPAPSYSIAPFRRVFVEKPLDQIMNGKLGAIQMPSLMPGVPEGTSLRDLRAAYHIRNILNVTRGRTSSYSTAQLVKATQGFNLAMKDLREETGGMLGRADVVMQKFHAAVTGHILGVEDLTPAERLDALNVYRERALMTPLEQIEGTKGAIAGTPETEQLRQFYKNLTSSKEYRDYFANPTPAMKNVIAEISRSNIEGLKVLGLDPEEVMQRSLAPAAHIFGKTAEEVLREKPEIVQAQTNVAIMASQIEKAVKDAGGGDVVEEARVGEMANMLPGTASITDKIKLVKDAIDSLKEDIRGDHSRISLNNNAESTGYLQGNTLGQKIAAGLHDRLGVDTAIAEPFAYGGVTNYFPSLSALRLNVRPGASRIGRAMDRLTGREPQGPILSEFKHGNPIKLLKAQELGVAPYSDFLHHADLNFFKGGVDRRDPAAFIRHVQQRERLLSHQLISEPMHDRMAAIDPRTGEKLTASNMAELQEKVGVQAAAKLTLLPMKAIRVMDEAENSAGRTVAGILKSSDGVVTTDISNLIDRAIDESGQETVRQITDGIIADKGKMNAFPTTYVNNLVKHARILDEARGAGRLWQGFINRWRTVVLAYMPSWALRTSVGHGFVIYLGGVWNPVHYIQAKTYFGDGFKVPGTDIHLAKGIDREVPAGVEQGTPHTDFTTQGPYASITGQIAHSITNTVHSVSNFQRRAAFLATLSKVTQLRFKELGEAMKIPRVMGAGHYDYVIRNHPEFVHDALNELDRVSYTFGQMSPFERKLAKNVMPFYGWYKFINRFVWSLPITYPGKTLAIARVAQIGASDMPQTGPIPSWLRSALLYDTHNLASVHYLSLLGLNPLGDVANPSEGVFGLARLGQLSPLIQAGLEAAGYDPLTGGIESIDQTSGIIEVNGQYYNVKTGQPSENISSASPLASLERAVGGLAREFPQLRIAEQWLTRGHAVYPESIPIVGEKEIPLATGAQPKNESPLSIGLSFLGIGPKTYNLQKWQTTQATNFKRALTEYNNALAKQRAQGLIPPLKVP